MTTDMLEPSTFLRNDTAERRNLAETLIERLKSGNESGELLQLARELAVDSDWQVRHEVALLIAYLPEADLQWFSEQLTNDTNAYVQRTARRTLKQRERHDREVAQRRQKQTRITRQIQKLQSRKQHPMAKQVGRMCRQHGEELVGQMVHDIRCISGRLQSACSEWFKSESAGESDAQRVMSEQLTMLDKLIDDWQRYSEPLSLNKRPERVRTVIDAAVRAARRNVAKGKAQVSGVKIKVEMNSGIVAPMVRHLVEIALTNVIQNALESFLVAGEKRPAGEIRVCAGMTSDDVTISVTDNGPGMTSDELEVISAFLPGRRNYAKPFSTGFGLAIAARNVAAHGGQLAITSHEGIGTQVTIDLPLDSGEQ